MSFAEEIAQAALRGWFGDAEGFKNMQQDASRRAAAREVTKVLARYFSWWGKRPEDHGAVVDQKDVLQGLEHLPRLQSDDPKE